jgi:hypothetical protein
MRKIELPSDQLGEELEKHLQDKRFSGGTYDKGRKAIQFPDNMDPSQWSSLRGTVEKWAKGKDLDVVESLKLQHPRHETAQPKVDPKELEAEVKKRLDKLTPQTAEERYRYLQSRPISELTEAEFEERLALAARSDKVKAPKK